MAHWLFKTEPSEYSYADLARDKHVTWQGVGNPQALIHLRAVQLGDTVVVYHTGTERSVVGLARVVRAPYPDPALGDARRVVVDLEPVRAFAAAVPLLAFRADPVLRTTGLVRNSRLSVMPLTAEQYARVLERAGSGA